MGRGSSSSKREPIDTAFSATFAQESLDAGFGFGFGEEEEQLDADLGPLGATVSPEQRGTMRAVATHLEAVIEADAEIVRWLRGDIDRWEERYDRLCGTRSELEREVQACRRESDRATERRGDAGRQVQHAKQQLWDLQAEMRSVSVESVSLRCDLEHVSGELAFMRKAYEDEARSVDALEQANVYLEKSFKGLEVHYSQLERQRRDAQQQVAAEKELTRQEERRNAELKNRLERLRRERASAVLEEHEALLRQRQLREMEGGKASRPVPDGVPYPGPRHSPAMPSAAARSVVQSGAPSAASGLGHIAAVPPAAPSAAYPAALPAAPAAAPTGHRRCGEPHSWAAALGSNPNPAKVRDAQGGGGGARPLAIGRSGPATREGV